MALAYAFISYLVKVIIFLCIAVGGFILGKRIRERRHGKN